MFDICVHEKCDTAKQMLTQKESKTSCCKNRIRMFALAVCLLIQGGSDSRMFARDCLVLQTPRSILTDTSVEVLFPISLEATKRVKIQLSERRAHFSRLKNNQMSNKF